MCIDEATQTPVVGDQAPLVGGCLERQTTVSMLSIRFPEDTRFQRMLFAQDMVEICR